MAVLINCPAILCAWNEKHWLEPELIEQKDLKQVKKDGVLSRVGGRKNGEWIINEP